MERRRLLTDLLEQLRNRPDAGMERLLGGLREQMQGQPDAPTDGVRWIEEELRIEDIRHVRQRLRARLRLLNAEIQQRRQQAATCPLCHHPAPTGHYSVWTRGPHH